MRLALGPSIAMVLAGALLAGDAPAPARAPSASPPPPAAAAEPWKPGMRAARQFARERRGRVAFVVRTPTREWHWHGDDRFASASVIKAMLMVAYLNRSEVRGRALERSERELLARMIRRSEDAAASTLIGIVGRDGLRRLARRAGMRRFVAVTPVWGDSRITAADQARFFERIDRLVRRRHRDFAMGLLETVTPAQRWGIADVAPPGWRLFFKGGWGTGTGLVDHQVGLLTSGEQRISLAILTAANGSHEYGKRTLRGVAKRLLGGLAPGAVVP
jgi:hypothetical protein